MKTVNNIVVSFINQGGGIYLINATTSNKRFQDTISRTSDGKRWFCASIAHETDTLREMKEAVMEYVTTSRWVS